MASRNGLNPKIRGPKGVGFSRALPSAFGFGNGIIGSNAGARGYLTVPSLVGEPIPNEWTIEFWAYLTEQTAFGGMLDYGDGSLATGGAANGPRLQVNPQGNPIYQLVHNTNLASIGSYIGGVNYGQKNHIVFTFDLSVNNGIVSSVINGQVANKLLSNAQIYSPPFLGVFSYFRILTFQGQGMYLTIPTDEFRMYNKIISDQEIVTNYNSGIGNNPTNTENLFVWYQFEKFENLDFSADQDGSNMQIGMRDMSGKNNHGMSVDLITDITDVNYCLKSF